MGLHISRPVVDNCKNIDSYGMICVGCNQCGRYTQICVNCGVWERDIRKLAEWSSIEFYNVFAAPICPKCIPLFPEEARCNYQEDIETYGVLFNHKILGYWGEFKPRGSR